MKRALLGLMLAVSFAGLSGCQKAKSSTRVNTGAQARANGVGGGVTQTPSGVELNAIVTGSSQSQFEIDVQNIVEATMPRDYVGSVSASGSDGTGVYLGGKVELQSGHSLNRATNSNQPIATNSELLFTIFDSFYVKNNLEPILPIYFKQAQGQITGNYAQIKFYDNYGFIQLEGQFDQNYFNATVTYQTSRTHDGATGRNGTLGTARIPTCQFFRCQ